MKSLCLVKEARHKRPHLYVFSLILRTQNTQAKHRYRKHSNDFPATMRETGVTESDFSWAQSFFLGLGKCLETIMLMIDNSLNIIK